MMIGQELTDRDSLTARVADILHLAIHMLDQAQDLGFLNLVKSRVSLCLKPDFFNGLHIKFCVQETIRYNFLLSSHV